MAASTEASRSVQPERPGRADGVCSEFTVFAPIKSGHTQALREVLAGIADSFTAPGGRAALQQVGTLHDARHVIFDDGRWFMFASVFDGSWDTYIDDFGKTEVGTNFEKVFSHTEGFPGITDPHVKEWFVAHQAPASAFVSSYPDLTVQQIWKDQRVNKAFQAVLDSPEFRTALDDPANAPLMASPAFRSLLDEASV